MICTFKKEDIIEGLNKAIGIIPLKSGSAYLRSMWIEVKENCIQIMATDSTTEFTGKYTAVIEEEGNIGVNARAFVDLIRKLPNGDIKLNYDSEAKILNIEQGRRHYKLATADSTWFKSLDDFPEENAVLWSGDYFQEVIEKTYFCISDDESSDQLACFYMAKVDNTINCCGLNGHQLAVAVFENEDLMNLLPNEGLLLQKKYTNELKKWLPTEEIYINFTDKKLFIKNKDGSEILSFVRSFYTYPNHQNFLQTLKASSISVLSVNRKEMIDALERVYIFNYENEKCTFFDLSDNELVLSAQGQRVGEAKEQLEIKYEGTIKRIAFPTKDLIEILDHFISEEITFIFTGIETPCGVRGEQDNDYTVIIMPMREASVNIYDEDDE